MSQSEYKHKNDVPDLYKILGLTNDVCSEEDCEEKIRKAYNKMAKKYHPDKHPGKKDIEEIFELITIAYGILKDESQRKLYNNKLSLEKQSLNDYFNLKDASVGYAESFGEYKEPSSQQKLTFDQQMLTINEKHGFDPSQQEAIPECDARKKLSSLAQTRAEQDRNFMPEKLFDDNRFDPSKFNAAFEKYHVRSEGAIANYNGVPSAWNEPGSNMVFSSFDELNNIYTNDNNRVDLARQSYGNVDFGESSKKITRDDISNLDGADYYSGHNVIGDDYYKTIKSKIRERGMDSDKFGEMKFNDYKRDDTAGYGIFDKLGYKFDDQLGLEFEEESVSSKFERLMAERQKESIPTEQSHSGSGSSTSTSSSTGKKTKSRVSKGR